MIYKTLHKKLKIELIAGMRYPWKEHTGFIIVIICLKLRWQIKE